MEYVHILLLASANGLLLLLLWNLRSAPCMTPSLPARLDGPVRSGEPSLASPPCTSPACETEPGLYRAGREELAESITDHELRSELVSEADLRFPPSHIEAGVYSD